MWESYILRVCSTVNFMIKGWNTWPSLHLEHREQEHCNGLARHVSSILYFLYGNSERSIAYLLCRLDKIAAINLSLDI